jgi:DNA processing protein
MKHYPKELYYKGDLSLLKRRRVAIVGSRKPNQYARELTHKLASSLAAAGVVVVSGGAIGTDIIAHKGAGAKNTIMVAGTGLDKRYPAINKNVIEEIEQQGLVLSQFRSGVASKRYNFPLRNELLVALGEVLVVIYADRQSGSMRSVEYAKKMGKEIYVLPHRMGESDGTNDLLEEGSAQAIFNREKFVDQFADTKQNNLVEDQFLNYCATNPSYDVVLASHPQQLFEYELMGAIEVVDGTIRVL